MKIVEKPGGLLLFELTENEPKENQDFYHQMTSFYLIRQGADVLVYHKNDGQFVSYLKLYDSTQFIFSSDGYSLAAAFGGKRFPVGNARIHLQNTQIKDMPAQRFERDRSFNLLTDQTEKIPFKTVNLSKLLKLKRSNLEELYHTLADLFNRCADFTPGKQMEYNHGSPEKDKLCRFNMNNNSDDIVTENLFLLDENDNIMGTISMMITLNAENVIDIYCYDEVVDYFLLLSSAEKKTILSLTHQLSKIDEQIKNITDPESTLILESDKKNVKQILKAIIEPKRLTLMASLFTAARQHLTKTLRKLLPHLSDDHFNQRLQTNSIRTFIRTAYDRTETYETLGCEKQNNNIFVIHGPKTPYASMLEDHVKNQVEAEFQKTLSKNNQPSMIPHSIFHNSIANHHDTTPIYKLSGPG